MRLVISVKLNTILPGVNGNTLVNIYSFSINKDRKERYYKDEKER